MLEKFDIDKSDINKLGKLQAVTTLNYCKVLYTNELDIGRWPDNIEVYNFVCKKHGFSDFPNMSQILGASRDDRQLTDGKKLKFLERTFKGSHENYSNGPFGSNLWGAIAGFPYDQRAKEDLAEILGISIAELAEFEEPRLMLLLEIFTSPRQKFMVLAYIIAMLHDENQPSRSKVVNGMKRVFMVNHDLYGNLKSWLHTIGCSLEHLYELRHIDPKRWFHNIQSEYSKPPYSFRAITPNKEIVSLGNLLRFWIADEDIPDRYSENGVDKLSEFIEKYQIEPILKE